MVAEDLTVTSEVVPALPVIDSGEVTDNTALEDSVAGLIDEEELEEIKFDTEPFRSRKVVSYTFGEGEYAAKWYIVEFALKNIFKFAEIFNRILDQLIAAGVLSKSENSDGESAVSDFGVIAKGLASVVFKAENDVYEILQAAIFVDQDHKTPITTEQLEDMTLTQAVILLVGVWEVNTSKKLKSALMSLGKKKKTPKKH